MINNQGYGVGQGRRVRGVAGTWRGGA